MLKFKRKFRRQRVKLGAGTDFFILFFNTKKGVCNAMAVLLGRSGQNWVYIQLWRPIKYRSFERIHRLHRRYRCLKTTQTSVLYKNNFSYISLLSPRVVYDSVFESSNTGNVGSNPTWGMKTCVHFPPAFVVPCRRIQYPSQAYSVRARMYRCKHNSRILFTRVYSVIGLLQNNLTTVYFTVAPCILIPSKYFICQLMHNIVAALKEY